MATLILIFLIAWLVLGEKESGRAGKQKKACQLILIGFIGLFDIALLIAYLCNIYLAPSELVKAKEKAFPIEQEIEALIADFSYIPGEDSRQELDEFLHTYNFWANELEIANEEVARHERRTDPHGRGNTLAKFLIDFGLFTGIY